VGDIVAQALAAATAVERASVSDGGMREWPAVQRMPVLGRSVATQRGVTRKTRKKLRWMTQLWAAWLVREALEVAESGPSWEAVHAYIVYASGARRRRCFIEPTRRGYGDNVLHDMIGMLAKYVLPSLYAEMFRTAGAARGMGKGHARKFFGDLYKALKRLFSEEGVAELEQSEAAAGKAIEKKMSARERRHAEADGDDSDDDWRDHQDTDMPDMTATVGSSSAMGGGATTTLTNTRPPQRWTSSREPPRTRWSSSDSLRRHTW
jgi:hypothetical protein